MTQEQRRFDEAMGRAIALASAVRRVTPPNPWVGCVVLDPQGRPVGEGATAEPGGPHAEVTALASAGAGARGATVVVTLEPCSHQGRTPPCAEALAAAGVRQVVIGIEDPDSRVSGGGTAALRAAGIEVVTGVREAEVSAQLGPYLHHRRTGRPFVVLKLATTLDGRIAAADGSSRWITGREARVDAHRLRAQSDAVLVGAGTVRADDPELTVREVDGADPRRIVWGSAPAEARVRPCTEVSGSPEEILERLGGEGVLQLLVEGGATVAGALHRARLVDRYVLYLAAALAGGDDAVPAFRGPAASTIEEMWRGRILSMEQLGPDFRVDLAP